MFELQSTNPALGTLKGLARDRPRDQATMAGVVEKTVVLTLLATIAGALSYALFPAAGSALLASCVASMVIGLGISWMLAGDPGHAPVLAPIYAISEGVFLGVLTRWLDTLLLVKKGAVAAGGSLALPAFIITIACASVVLYLTRVGVLQASERFKAVMITLTLGVMLAYLAMFFLSFVGVRIPYLSITSALQGGKPALIGLALNLGILVLASLWLVIDMAEIQETVDEGLPRRMEWYGAFTFMVTLTWIYYEAVKLAFRLAASSRD